MPDDAALRAANARLRELPDQKDAQIAALRARLAGLGELRGQVAELQAQAADLTARAKQNTGNSSKPPPPDGLGKPAPRPLRKKAGQKPGQPKGQPGATMPPAGYPDHVARHQPLACRKCGTGQAGARETGTERRQVTEIPPVRAEVTEHQMTERECPCCGARTKGQAPAAVTARVQYGPPAAAPGVYLRHGQFLSRDRACAAMADMFGCAPAPAALAAMAKKIAGLAGSARRLMPGSS